MESVRLGSWGCLRRQDTYKKVDGEGYEDGVVVAPEGVGDDGAEDRRQVAGAKPHRDVGGAGQVAAVEDGLQVHHQVRRDAIERCALQALEPCARQRSSSN